MSDQTPPPKPKPGSLRDRIAAFEKPTQSTGPPPVAPRPKPGGHVAWKPKPATPPDSPAADESPSNQPKKSGGGMSASDAKESIGKGGSLKERMAALQGKGAFGAPPPIAPKPATEKPKWKPPPPVASPLDEERETATDKAEEASPSSTTARLPGDKSNKALGVSDSFHPEAQPQIEAEGEAQEHVDVDLEEEERQRRTALAARMARLGGARVGMGPPVFGGPAYKKPQPKPEPKSDTLLKEDVSELVKSDITEPTSKEPSLKSPPAPETEDKPDEGTKKEYFDVERKASDASSLLSPDPTASTSNSPRTPSSMPVPAAPRRAAPPRRKAAKSPAPQLPTEQETSNIDPSIDSTEKETEVHPPSDIDPKELSTVVSIGPLVDDDAPLEPQIAEEPSMIVAVEETPIPTTRTESEEPEAIETVSAASGSLTEEPEPITTTHVETEEDEASRRQRVAERLAKSGGVNPFALPPQRKPSSPIVSSEDPLALTSAPVSPASQERTSVRKASTDSVFNSFSAPPARRGSQMSMSSVSPPTKKPSTDSVSSHDIIPHDDDINAAGISEEPESSLVEEADITDEELADEELSPEEYAEDNPATDFREISRAPAVLPITDIKPIVTVPPPKPAPTVDELGKFPHPAVVGSENEPEDEHYTPPPSPRRTMPPPPRLVPETVEQEEEVKHSLPQHTESPRRLPPRQVLEDDGEMSDAPLPHPNRLSVLSTPPESDDAAEEDHISDDEPKPIPASRPIRLFPLSEHSATEETVVPEGKLDSTEIESPEEILPTPPRRPFQEQPPVQEEPLFIPPPPPPKAPTTAPRRASTQVGKAEPPPHTVEQQSVVSTPALSVSNVDTRRAEILDEEEGDPIDPSFHSPPSRRTSALPVALHTTKSEPEQAPVEDEEQARRRTIAERMAKLGGLKLGAAPISMSRPAPAKRRESQEGSHQIEVGSEETVEGEPELTEEEEEKARKERIAAKMASMGGMRIGMQPYGMFGGKAPLTPSKPVAASSENDSLHAHPPPRHAAPPPPPPPQDIDSEHESLSTSDEGVRVEAEESEMEEVNYEDAEEEQDEIPPPIPTREGRHSVPHPTGRPPVPTALPSRKASIQSTTSQKSNDTASLPIPRKSSVSQTLPPSTEYVMVEGEEEEELAPPPPPRVGRPAPPRAAPLPPPSTSTVPPSESISSHWEMPSIPSVDFGGHADLSLSWTDDMASSTSSAPPSAEPSATRSTREPVQTTAANLGISSDDLVAIWGRVGVQVCEVATTLFEKSKKALIGDGTYYGFIDATLKEVPNAAPISEQDIGYLIYMQSGASVQKRAGEILPGDIVWMHDAKFKGHKGLQNYSQIVGSAEPLVGVVSEFEAKKFKIRVFQANQHVGQQTVEAVSYRLEDLKSGQVKIFRVLEA